MPAEWKAQVLRFTLFPAGDWEATKLDVWHSLIESDPDSDEIKPKERARRTTGTFREDVGLEIRTAIDRLDFFFVPKAEEPAPDAHLGPPEPMLKLALSALSQWLEKAPFDVFRVALGTHLISPQKDRLEGYKTLLESVHSLNFTPGTDITDVVLQINRRIQSKVIEAQLINRLLKLSVIQFNLVAFTGPSVTNLRQVPSDEGGYFARLELDVNTVPRENDRVLEKAKLPAIFKELAELTIEISAHGEPK